MKINQDPAATHLLKIEKQPGQEERYNGFEKDKGFGQFGGGCESIFFADGEHEIAEKHIESQQLIDYVYLDMKDVGRQSKGRQSQRGEDSTNKTEIFYPSSPTDVTNSGGIITKRALKNNWYCR
ncbi:unnamed protein product [Dovyalis caffra]|uniref:Uncharacterized protein n=1 Tax=Dovyalis caffra TaxID=77055 RepID=A0AAV1SUB3_9ROSI|nr:unnamed protein product [Dovyalis caffra]